MKRVAGTGFEPVTEAYETSEIAISLTRNVFLRQEDVLDKRLLIPHAEILS